MDKNEITVRRIYEDWSELITKLDALASTINSIKYGLEHEGIEEQVTECLTTVSDSIYGILQYATKRQFNLAYLVKDEEKRHE